MSPLLLQVFAYMSCTFILGLCIGWVVWRYETDTNQVDKSEVDFWRSNLEQCRGELGNEKDINATLRDQTETLKKQAETLKKRLIALQEKPKS